MAKELLHRCDVVKEYKTLEIAREGKGPWELRLLSNHEQSVAGIIMNVAVAHCPWCGVELSSKVAVLRSQASDQ